MEEIIVATARLINISGELGSFSNQLTGSIKQTDKIVASINNIARQANLLALNASVETAHVGTLGRDFNVVAGEMHKLAVESDEPVKTIKDLLNKVQHTIIQVNGRV